MAPGKYINTSSYLCSACRKTVFAHKRRRLASTLSTSHEIYDVVTVGGGPAGLALLAALKSSPITSHLKTALIETQDLSRQRKWQLSSELFSNRASSLTPSTVDFLDKTGVWKHVDQSRVQPYDEMQVWDAANDSSIQFDWKREARQYNAPPQTVATMVENANLTKGLLGRIAELDGGSSFFSNTSVSAIENGRDDPEGLNLSTWPTLSLSPKESSSPSPTNITARLLVGADGFNSPVRAYAGISSHGWDYNRHGIVATLTLEPNDETSNSFDSLLSEDPSNRATAYQRFLPQLGGPIAILPLPNNHASLVWSTTPSTAAYLKTLPPPALIAVLNAALRLSQPDLKYLLTLPAASPTQHPSELDWRLAHTSPPATLTAPLPIITSVQPNTLASFPLRFRHATSLTGPRVALIGDAAHTIHPLAGQGLNLGLADAHALASTITAAVEHGMDLGDPMALEPYASKRFGKGLLMGGGVDALNSLYQLGGGGDGLVSSLLGRARGLGMKVINSDWIPGLKSAVMRQAEG